MTKPTKSYVSADGQVLRPYVCPRECAKAIEWYAEVFGATEIVERFVEPDGRIGHAEIDIDGAPIMLSDAYPDYGAVAPEIGNTTTTFALEVYVPDADATMAQAAEAGANVQRPVQDEFYGDRVGTMIDPFGVRWRICTHVRDVSAEEIAQAAQDYTGAEPGPVS